jgi:hypothetical protein
MVDVTTVDVSPPVLHDSDGLLTVPPPPYPGRQCLDLPIAKHFEIVAFVLTALCIVPVFHAPYNYLMTALVYVPIIGTAIIRRTMRERHEEPDAAVSCVVQAFEMISLGAMLIVLICTNTWRAMVAISIAAKMILIVIDNLMLRRNARVMPL